MKKQHYLWLCRECLCTRTKILPKWFVKSSINESQVLPSFLNLFSLFFFSLSLLQIKQTNKKEEEKRNNRPGEDWKNPIHQIQFHQIDLNKMWQKEREPMPENKRAKKHVQVQKKERRWSERFLKEIGNDKVSEIQSKREGENKKNDLASDGWRCWRCCCCCCCLDSSSTEKKREWSETEIQTIKDNYNPKKLTSRRFPRREEEDESLR